MSTNEKIKITVQAEVSAPIDFVWECWTLPEHVIHWNNASPDWHTPRAENDLRVGGKFNYRMEAKDGSFGFDFWGIYDKIIINELIENTLGDDRKVVVTFSGNGVNTKITETFEAETQNSVDLQRQGWQAILDNFKKYTESQSDKS